MAVSAVYAPIDFTAKHEELVRAIINQECPDVKVSIGKEVANIGQSMSIPYQSSSCTKTYDHDVRALHYIVLIYSGLLERENATILNASLLNYASQVVAGFIDSVHQLQLDCPLFLTSNDGTLMTCDQAVRFPIKTFSSGPTNSMRGANFLASWASGGPRKETALVVDVGGTTVSPFPPPQYSYLPRFHNFESSFHGSSIAQSHSKGIHSHFHALAISYHYALSSPHPHTSMVLRSRFPYHILSHVNMARG